MMGFSSTLSEVIIVIASVILASGVSGYVVYTGSLLRSDILMAVDAARMEMSIQLEIVYASINGSTTPSHYVVYVKNVGCLSLMEYESLDLYAGRYREAELYRYHETASPGSGLFTVKDGDGDGVWESGETAILRAYPREEPQGDLFEARVKPFRGVGSSYLFTRP